MSKVPQKLPKELPEDYAGLLIEVKERIRTAQYTALKAVNKELIKLYWDIGKMIAEQQRQKGCGKAVVVRLADDLQKEFPGIKGFSTQNLWYMRQFYLEYCNNKKGGVLKVNLSFENIFRVFSTEYLIILMIGLLR